MMKLIYFLNILFVFVISTPATAEISGHITLHGLSDSPNLNDDDTSGGVTLGLRFSDNFENTTLSWVLDIEAQKLSFHDRIQLSHLPREAYLDYSGENFDLRIGKQLLIYGVADGYNPSDVITPTNFRFQSYDEQGDRFGVWGIKATTYAGDWSFSGFWNPYHNSSIAPASSDLGILNIPNDSIKEVRDSFALRAAYSGSDLDFSVMAYSGASALPALKPTGNGAVFEAADLNMFSAEFVHVNGPFRIFTELASLDYNSMDVPGLRDEIAGVVGIEYELSTDWRLISQVFHREFDAAYTPDPNIAAIATANTWLFGQFGENQNGASLSLVYGAELDDLSGDVTLLQGFDQDEMYLRGRLKYRFDDTTSFSVRGDYFNGPQNSVFGSLKNASRLAVEFQKQF